MQDPSEMPPDHEHSGQDADSALGLLVHRLLWILLAMTLGLNTTLNLLGHGSVAIVFGCIAIVTAVVLLLRYLKRRYQ